MKKHLLTLILFLGLASYAYAQRTLSGTINNSKGDPLVGASVVEKGTTNGAITASTS